MGGLLRLITQWWACPRCQAKDAMIAFLEKALTETRRREQAAIDHLLAFQGKPEIRETHLSKTQIDRLLNPFAEDYPEPPAAQKPKPSIGKDLPKNIFDDVTGLKD